MNLHFQWSDYVETCRKPCFRNDLQSSLNFLFKYLNLNCILIRILLMLIGRK